METEETLERPILHERVTIHEPADGWTRDFYDQQLNEYVATHGRAPQTVTLHPDTMEALGLEVNIAEASANPDSPILVVSREYEQDTITLYY
jgi:hypothetical protein